MYYFVVRKEHKYIQEETVETEIITICCRRDDFLISVDHRDDLRSRMSTAEVMTTALTAAAFFPAIMKKAVIFSKDTEYSGDALEKSVQPPSSPDIRITSEILYGRGVQRIQCE